MGKDLRQKNSSGAGMGVCRVHSEENTELGVVGAAWARRAVEHEGCKVVGCWVVWALWVIAQVLAF